MSSPKKEEENLKAGHPPAVKVGGMRTKGSKHHEEKPSKEEVESPWESEVAKQRPAPVMVSGVLMHGNKDLPPEAIKVAHEKPQPTAIKPVQNKQINRNIHQPR